MNLAESDLVTHRLVASVMPPGDTSGQSTS